MSSLYFVLIEIGVGDLVKNYNEKPAEKTLTFAIWIQNSNQFVIQVNVCGKFKKSTEMILSETGRQPFSKLWSELSRV